MDQAATPCRSSFDTYPNIALSHSCHASFLLEAASQETLYTQDPTRFCLRETKIKTCTSIIPSGSETVAQERLKLLYDVLPLESEGVWV